MSEAAPKTARIFKSGNSMAIRLPKEFRFPGKEVIIEHWGRGAIIVPAEDPWAPLWASLEQFAPSLKLKRGQPPMQHRKGISP